MDYCAAAVFSHKMANLFLTSVWSITMPKAADVKRGNLIELNGQYMLVQQIDVKSPTARGAQTLYRDALQQAARWRQV